VTDKDNVYTWSDSTDEDAPNGSAFTESTDGAAVTGGYAGHCDWRLPQADELQSILL
jgi:hypothetical protein